MSRYFSFTLLGLLSLAIGCAQAQPLKEQPPKAPALVVAPLVDSPEVSLAPTWDVKRTFEQLGRASDSLLRGTHTTDQFEFTLRRDRIASDAKLQLEYTPSPALLPTLSHLRVYLNDVLMSVIPIDKEQLGKKTVRQVDLDPRLVSDFNRVRLEFVGHYTDICEDPSNSTLWVNISRTSLVSLKEQALIVKNDLAYFPTPFYDPRGYDEPVLTMVFAASPTQGEQRAAGILASYFGSQAAWRGTQFPVLFDRLPVATTATPVTSSIVFATNSHRPAFLADLKQFPAVEAPVVQMIDNPNDRYSKVLLVLGRDEADLVVAAQALALGGDLFRGERVVIDKVQQIQPRQPYDAPNWMRTDRAVRFAELIKYPEQLRATGLQPLPISLDINLPPDLFVWRNQGIPLQTKYRYTPPPYNDGSRLNISLNNQFITSLPLLVNSNDRLEELRLAVLSSESANVSEKLSVPALKIGDRNNLKFNFSFATTTSSSQRDHCQTSLPVDIQAVIDDQSTIDMSGYHHYIAMPDLAAFARSGFPYSRMADLSETVVMMPPQPSAVQLSTYLEAVAGISARSGLPAMNLLLSDNWEEASRHDADLLILGSFAPDMRDNQDMNLLLDRSRDWLLKANNQGPGSSQSQGAGNPAANRVEVSAKGPIAAIVGLQSPFHEQRSIVALLATDDADFELLRQTLNDSGKMEAVAGSVALIRSSGVHSQMVGDQYYVGNLPWWLMLWFKLSEHPILLAFLAVFGVLLTAFLTWRILKLLARRRLAYEE
ncbi:MULTISPECIES: cellulose biosynthesis cyclic di-GMP-binding regulatory protein BcsB [Pseudomonas]|uniref:Cyclic di-GMP-binding protein n=1 Tax=Pseudomonas lactis TaxID=1615674 RepID=A0A921NJK6_9PSED|nr:MULTISPECIES: cellulose biosynthesis cyclic di-GMP-binding regulatory protein BcsB [Pseudomonas]HJH20843.1 cellulose biosynthesis cyclic di-GMP-binding regulatory protein BcsB [Pseudomonas lactis]